MKTWTLRGATTSYVVGVPEHGGWAQLVAWGPHAVAGGPSTMAPVGTEHFLPRADVEPLEYAVRGVRYAAPVDLVVSGPDGVDELRPVFVDAQADATSLDLVFADRVRDVQLVLHYRIEGDAVERWVAVRNDGAEVLTLHRHDSAGFTVPSGNTIRYLWGEWNSEFQQSEITFDRGRFAVNSAQGITGHSYSPFLAVGGYGVQLAWSGSWELTADADITGTIRIQAGRTSSSQGLKLQPGETWTSPKAVGACSAEGADGLARVFHDYERVRSRRRTPKVLYNSWFATEFDIRAEHQLALAKKAAGIGVETFVVDDGWFTGRVDDAGGLGDWEVDPKPSSRKGSTRSSAS